MDHKKLHRDLHQSSEDSGVAFKEPHLAGDIQFLVNSSHPGFYFKAYVVGRPTWGYIFVRSDHRALCHSTLFKRNTGY